MRPIFPSSGQAPPLRVVGTQRVSVLAIDVEMAIPATLRHRVNAFASTRGVRVEAVDPSDSLRIVEQVLIGAGYVVAERDGGLDVSRVDALPFDEAVGT